MTDDLMDFAMRGVAAQAAVNRVIAAEEEGMTHNISLCSSCQAEIIWAITKNGKRQPIDAKAEKRIRLLPGSPPLALVEDVYTPHHQTCPHGDWWHKKAQEDAGA